MSEPRKVIRDTDAEAVRLGKTLTRSARFGALAALDPATGAPIVSRVGVATDVDGAPIILVSMLAAHTKALLADPRCALLLGEPGKGDALAYPRISLSCEAAQIGHGDLAEAQIRRRYLSRNPKAALYVELGDFYFFRLAMRGAALNSGFGRAYHLSADDLSTAIPDGFSDMEQGVIDHMNGDHTEAISLYAQHFAGLEAIDWRMSGLDPDGIDLVCGERIGRVFFPAPLTDAGLLRETLVEMAKTARVAQRVATQG